VNPNGQKWGGERDREREGERERIRELKIYYSDSWQAVV
jgi:hypothetical protein